MTGDKHICNLVASNVFMAEMKMPLKDRSRNNLSTLAKQRMIGYPNNNETST